MAKTEVGDRVGAILGAKDGVVEFLGYGEYKGEEVPETAVGWIAEAAQNAGITNPKIELDNGSVVWGCECWWGPEDTIQSRLQEYDKVVNVDIQEYRNQVKNG